MEQDAATGQDGGVDVAGLVCPTCGERLEPSADADGTACLRDGNGHSYPVVRGIPRLVPGGRQTQTTDTLESFNYQYGKEDWIFEHDRDRAREIVETVFRIPAERIRGGRVAVVGCGSGAEVDALASRGAREVVGFDLTEEIVDAARNTAGHENVTIVQADATRPPLRPESCDVVYCDGVIPHTRDPEATLRAALSLLAPGGAAYIRTLLRPQDLRQRLHLLPRLAVRSVLKRLPSAALWRLCYGFGLLDQVPALGWLGRRFFIYHDPVNPSLRVTQLTNFRMYGDHVYRHRMAKERVAEVIRSVWPDAAISINGAAFVIERPGQQRGTA